MTDKPATIGAKSAMDLPGGRTQEEAIARMVRVDHAGEHGAVKIYEGQLAVFGRSPRHAKTAALIRDMAAQEERHLEGFDRVVNERRVRPTLLSPLWSVAGFALGAATALMGEKAAMACTAAVEEAIDEHYARQESLLEGRDPELKAMVSEYRADEAEHRQTALDHGAEETPGYGLLSGAIKAGCRLAIRLSERV
jgi:ubiquinone biosynthesis monooxygenase Coq7